MSTSAREIVQLFQQRMPVLEKWEEHLAERDYAICVDANEWADELRIPLCLRHANTEIGEIFKPNWSDPDALAVVVTRLDELCSYWENVYAAHSAARDRFAGALRKKRDYCLYLRSFSTVTLNVLDEPIGRAVAYVNTENLDRNVGLALANSADLLAPVSCQHPDDMALLEGKWRVPAFRVHDHTWQAVVQGAIEAAKCIVFYLDEATPGASFELDTIRARNLKARTVIVHTDRASLPEDAESFAATFRASEFLTLSKDLMQARLRSPARKRLEGLMRDDFRPKPVDNALLSIPCNVVDPKVPERFAGKYDAFQAFCITSSNLTAFGWFVSGLPDALLQWNDIDRLLYQQKRAPTIAAMNQLLGSLFRGCLGAASLGLTASLGGLIGLHAIVAHLVVVPDPDKSRARNDNLLRALEIANRFDALTDRHDWRKYNDEWRQAIVEGRFFPT
jgi:hypothetical protein